MIRRLLVAALVVAASSVVNAQPRVTRIVSTSPSITEVLFALGLGDRVVGVSTYCRYPAEVVTLPKVGSFLRPNAEVIARLRPDLVVVSSGLNDVPRQLSQLGIRTITVDDSRTLASVYSTVRELGRAAGVTPRAETLVAELQARLDRVRMDAAARPKRKVLLVVGRGPASLTDLVAVGRGTYLHELLEIAGGVNVLDDPALPNYPRISMETVIRLEPDVIVDAGDMGNTVAEYVRRQPITEGLWKQQSAVKAARAGAVHAVTSDAFFVAGPRMVEAAEIVAAWLRDAGRR